MIRLLGNAPLAYDDALINLSNSTEEDESE